MTHDRLKHLVSQLLIYNWEDEEEDYRENPSYGHIFRVMVELNNYLFDLEDDADDLCGLNGEDGQ